MLADSEPSDVQSEANPYGSNAYRGVTVGEDHIHSGVSDFTWQLTSYKFFYLLSLNISFYNRL